MHGGRRKSVSTVQYVWVWERIDLSLTLSFNSNEKYLPLLPTSPNDQCVLIKAWNGNSSSLLSCCLFNSVSIQLSLVEHRCKRFLDLLYFYNLGLVYLTWTGSQIHSSEWGSEIVNNRLNMSFEVQYSNATFQRSGGDDVVRAGRGCHNVFLTRSLRRDLLTIVKRRKQLRRDTEYSSVEDGTI